MIFAIASILLLATNIVSPMSSYANVCPRLGSTPSDSFHNSFIKTANCLEKMKTDNTQENRNLLEIPADCLCKHLQVSCIRIEGTSRCTCNNIKGCGKGAVDACKNMQILDYERNNEAAKKALKTNMEDVFWSRIGPSKWVNGRKVYKQLFLYDGVAEC
jgi:hypothetical protein